MNTVFNTLVASIAPRRRLAAGLLPLLAASVLSLMAGGAHAQGPASTAPAASERSAALPWVAGEIRRIDLAQQRLTIRHANIPNLDMDAMTMVFKLKPGLLTPEQLAALKVGDKVEFQAEEPQGQLTAVALRPAGAKASDAPATPAPAAEDTSMQHHQH